MLEVLAYLQEIGQKHLGLGLESLTPAQCDAFLKTLKCYGPATLAKQRALLLKPPVIDLSSFCPLDAVSRFGSTSDRMLGESLIAQGKVGCLILAGGQGTRLGHDGPKGTLAISPIMGKSLFQLFSEHTFWAGKRAERLLPLAIMTSPLNDEVTRGYFEAHARFGLEPSQLFFFSQSMLPLLESQGNWLLNKPGTLAVAPDGNGHALQKFYELGIWEKWRESGVEYLNVIFVDNPLADPFDAEFIGFTARNALDIGMKVVERLSKEEKMGIVVREKEKIKVVEYSEFSAELTACYSYASPGLFCFHMDFIRGLYQDQKNQLPLHLAHKTASVIPIDGIAAEQRPVYKFETFQFDLLHFTHKSDCLAIPRQRTYAPIKNAHGEKSPSSASAARLALDREIYSELTGSPPSSLPFELDPAFYYPTDAMKEHMRGRTFPTSDYMRIDMV